VRLGGVTDKFTFKPEGAYLRAQSSVVEPHSFDVKIGARIDNKVHNWAYQSYEGRVEIAVEAAAAGGVKTETAGPAKIRSSARVTGRIIIDPARSAQVMARFPGVLRELRKTLGERVAKGEIVAMVESNDSLQAYAIKSPVDGIVYSQNARVGEIVGQLPILEIGDMSRVVAELQVFPRDAAKLKVGQPVSISAIDGDMNSESSLAMILPTTDAGSQAVPARVVLDNANNAWRPGMLIEADITIGTADVPLAVRTSGLQRFRDFDVVFAKVGDTYEVRMLELGARDDNFVEVVGGLVPGTTYVTESSFLIKADIEKSGASHDH
jgi:cobalt-zinc-cadmium efflux system membrane fusion protein